MAEFLHILAILPLVDGRRLGNDGGMTMVSTPLDRRALARPTATARSRPGRPPSGLHWAWVVAAVTFVTLVGSAAFRSVPGVLMDPLHMEFGWSHAHDRLRGVGEHGAVRADLAVRRGADGPVRDPAGGHRSRC